MGRLPLAWLTAAVAALLLVEGSEASSHALLFTTANLTSGNPQVSYTSCAQSKGLIVGGTALTNLHSIQIGARWFGAQTATPADFEVVGCQNLTLNLDGGRTVPVFNSTQSEGCKVSWFADSNNVYLQVMMTTEKDSWYFSFPQDARQLTQHTCTPVSDSSSCAIAPITQCNSLPVNSEPGQATFYPDAFPDCSDSNSSSLALPNFDSLVPDAATPPRCQDALNYQVYNDTLPSSPALEASKFSSCYAFQLTGYVYVANNTGLQFLSQDPDPSYYKMYRICVRYNGLIKVNLNGVTIVSSAASVEYDATLVCHDVSNMQQGLLPLTVQYASGKSVHFLTEPLQQSVILQMFIIPVSQVWQVANPVSPASSTTFTYACSCCGLFGPDSGGCGAGCCCTPLDTCSFFTPSCTAAGATPGFIWPVQRGLYDSGWSTRRRLLPDLMRPLPRRCCSTRWWQQHKSIGQQPKSISFQSSNGVKPSG
eukprot:jgi/Astpho2/3901/fgenesh1_pg.00062_%23_65_t